MDRIEALLSKVVTDGKVDYGAVCTDPGLAASLQEIAVVDASRLGRKEDRIAFFLNAYNVAAVALACRLLARPGRRRRDLRAPFLWLRFFVLARVRVARRRRTLFGLEFWTLRRLTRDPRIHCALVCASDSCPPLKDGRYHGDDLDQELDLAARAFVRPGVGYTFDAASNTLTVSRIFRWYRRDFARVGGARAFIMAHAPAEDAKRFGAASPRLRFARYRWTLNEADPRPSSPLSV